MRGLGSTASSFGRHSMARPREFDLNEALQAAMLRFWERGYEATSVDDLLQRMGINRASLYGTFGQKRELFLKALRQYGNQFGYDLLLERARHGSPKRAIKELFEETIENLSGTPPEKRRGCLIQNKALELAPHDAEIGKIVRENVEKCHALFAQVLELAKEKGELKKTPRNTLGVVATIRAAAKVSQTGGASYRSVPVWAHARAHRVSPTTPARKRPSTYSQRASPTISPIGTSPSTSSRPASSIRTWPLPTWKPICVVLPANRLSAPRVLMRLLLAYSSLQARRLRT
jgi:TetR/AcrR family transcriptional regulator, transcriptional repressor for nem operon